MNTAEMARRQFRYIARVAGLLIPDMPGKRKPTRDLQVSANLLFEVFTRYDPDNLASRAITPRNLGTPTRARAIANDSFVNPRAPLPSYRNPPAHPNGIPALGRSLKRLSFQQVTPRHDWSEC
jgi:ATP-dependent Lhr-like helicase